MGVVARHVKVSRRPCACHVDAPAEAAKHLPCLFGRCFHARPQVFGKPQEMAIGILHEELPLPANTRGTRPVPHILRRPEERPAGPKERRKERFDPIDCHLQVQSSAKRPRKFRNLPGAVPPAEHHLHPTADKIGEFRRWPS